MKTPWLVYKVRWGERGPIMKLLGEVRAEHQPEALEKAWAQWPSEKDPSQVQAGFSVRQTKTRLNRRTPEEKARAARIKARLASTVWDD